MQRPLCYFPCYFCVFFENGLLFVHFCIWFLLYSYVHSFFPFFVFLVDYYFYMILAPSRNDLYSNQMRLSYTPKRFGSSPGAYLDSSLCMVKSDLITIVGNISCTPNSSCLSLLTRLQVTIWFLSLFSRIHFLTL